MQIIFSQEITFDLHKIFYSVLCLHDMNFAFYLGLRLLHGIIIVRKRMQLLDHRANTKHKGRHTINF